MEKSQKSTNRRSTYIPPSNPVPTLLPDIPKPKRKEKKAEEAKPVQEAPIAPIPGRKLYDMSSPRIQQKAEAQNSKQVLKEQEVLKDIHPESNAGALRLSKISPLNWTTTSYKRG
jgi:hypothetical protein